MIIVTDRQPKIQAENILSTADMSAIAHCVAHYPDPRAASLDALKIVQKNNGWVDDGQVLAVAQLLGLSAAEVEEVATFYNRIYRQPVGRHVILMCDSVACYLMGSDDVATWLRFTLKIDFGGTTADGRFTLLPICCLGNCDKAPTLMIDDDTHHMVSSNNLQQILEAYA